MDLEEKTINKKEIYAGNIINLRYDEVLTPAGNKVGREIVEHSGGVTIIAIRNDDKILLVEQFRKPTEECLLELPAGKLEEDEDPLECAKRELIEETGYQAGEIEHLFSFYTSPGFCDEVLHLYIARDLKEVGIDPDEDENIIIHTIERSDILGLIEGGEVKDSKTIIGLLYYLVGDFNV